MPDGLEVIRFNARFPCRCAVSAGLLLALTLLAGCNSVPLPPWQISSPVANAGGRALPAAAGAPQAAVQQTAVSPATVTPPTQRPSTYSMAVQARFPEPSVVYSTPGLQAARTSFTSQAEIQAWLRDQAAAARTSGVTAAVIPIGKSALDEVLEALVLTRATSTDPTALLASARPTVLLVGQQQGDEPAGSEALLVISRELAQGLLQPVLQRINVVIVPRANPDGAASARRPIVGVADLSHDHLLLDTPEAQALARLMRDYRPTVVVDAQEYTVDGGFTAKFGAVQKFDALVQYATTANLPEFLTKAAEEWYRRPLLAALKAQALSSEWYYTTSSNVADRKVSMGGVRPDNSRNVNGLKNSVSLLVETRGGGLDRMHIQRRVHTHVTSIMSVLASTAQRAAELAQLRPYIDKEVSAQACKDDAVVDALPTASRYELQMLDPVSGTDKSVTVDWNSDLALRTIKTRTRPCGYWLSAGSLAAVNKLRLHGVQVQRLAEPGAMLGDVYREVSRSIGERDDARGSAGNNKKLILAQVRLARGLVDVPRGSYYIPLNQAIGNLVLAALEPDTQSSFFANQVLQDLQSTVRVMALPTVKLEDIP